MALGPYPASPELFESTAPHELKIVYSVPTFERDKRLVDAAVYC